jgi:hypothetical protein
LTGVDWVRLLPAVAFISLIPGLPFAIHLARKSDTPALVCATSPLLSITITYLSLGTLNIVGLNPNLTLFGIFLLCLTVIGLISLRPYGQREVVAFVEPLIQVIPAAIVGLAIWAKAYSDVNFVAPNDDGFRHNLWIARIADVKSVLPWDSFVDSPLQKLGSGGGFYPFAWHGASAVTGSMTGVAVPILSLGLVVSFWILVLPLGLVALARLLSSEMKLLGATAAVLVQLYPLVPANPLSWGSLTSCVGVALLPSAFVMCVVAMKTRIPAAVLAATTGAVGLALVHTPEAGSVIVMSVGAAFLLLRDLSKRQALYLGCALLACGLPVTYLYRDFIFGGLDSIKSLYGAIEPNWERAIGGFFALNINTSLTSSILSLLFVIGAISIAYMRVGVWFIGALGALFFVYLASGSGSGSLSPFRVLTSPWYASYERTSWVVVPFAALTSAYVLVLVLRAGSERGLFLYIASLGFLVLSITLIAREQVALVVGALRKGSLVNEVVGFSDRGLIDRLEQRLEPDEVVLTLAGDGSTYVFMYNKIPATGGRNYGRSGEISDDIATIYRDLGDICASHPAQEAIENERIGAFVFGDWYVAWGGPAWSEERVRQLPGLKFVEKGDHLMVAIPDLAKCDK